MQSSSDLGIYVHIPFCIQRCHYCDFATYAKDEIQANQIYVDTLLLEAKKRSNLFQKGPLKTIYFGGGTPSLLEPEQIHQIISGLHDLGFQSNKDTEITMEVNPATIDQDKARGFFEAGVNRVSIGCQSFDDKFLKICGREHNVQDTFETIELAKEIFGNFSLDLLFSLPNQSEEDLEKDLLTLKELDPPHISAYCLTLPDKHPMNKGRPGDEVQLEMFKRIFASFDDSNLSRYEISNFAKTGFESRHNLRYWTDKDFWALGLSAHSYRSKPNWGTRFWNPSKYDTYLNSITKLSEHLPLEESFAGGLHETLAIHEAMTDFAHTSLRLTDGLYFERWVAKFGEQGSTKLKRSLNSLAEKGMVTIFDGGARLSEQGLFLSNLAFAELLFTPTDIDN